MLIVGCMQMQSLIKEYYKLREIYVPKSIFLISKNQARFLNVRITEID